MVLVLGNGLLLAVQSLVLLHLNYCNYCWQLLKGFIVSIYTLMQRRVPASALKQKTGDTAGTQYFSAF
jgi:hypothetical protein